MTIIFKTKTSEAYHIKIMAELLSNNLKTAHLEIDEKGIKLCQMDLNRRILIKMDLYSENFETYKFQKNKPKIYLGLNLNHFHKMLRSIKKKDSLQLYIDDDSPADLVIRVIPKEQNRVTNSYIKIQTVQEIEINVPADYDKPIILSSSEFQKMIKDLGNIGSTINIRATNYRIQFGCDAGGVLKRTVDFGETVDSDDEADQEIYNQTFLADQLARITKMAGLDTPSPRLKIFPGYPLLFKSNVGNLGEISIYIKSKEQQETEENEMNGECSDE